MCIPKGEKIMLLVQKRFHVFNPVDGGTQQLYNMLWDYDLSPMAKSVLLPPPQIGMLAGRMGVPGFGGTSTTENPLGWDRDDLNPDVHEEGVELKRTTLWLMDDLAFLCKKYNIYGQYHSKEVIDLSKYPEEKWPIYEKTARDFYFKVFEPKDIPDDPDEPVSSDSDLDSSDDDFDPDSTETEMLDSTTDFKEDEKEMKRIISFFAKMPKVTKLV